MTDHVKVLLRALGCIGLAWMALGALTFMAALAFPLVLIVDEPYISAWWALLYLLLPLGGALEEGWLD